MSLRSLRVLLLALVDGHEIALSYDIYLNRDSGVQTSNLSVASIIVPVCA